jgi:hypothetical protein
MMSETDPPACNRSRAHFGLRLSEEATDRERKAGRFRITRQRMRTTVHEPCPLRRAPVVAGWDAAPVESSLTGANIQPYDPLKGVLPPFDALKSAATIASSPTFPW